jgi:hypothetical protein
MEDRRDAILQLYYDRISSVLLDKQVLLLADSAKRLGMSYRDPVVESARYVIKARTLSILVAFSDDLERRSAVVRFLADSGILRNLDISLEDVDLSGCNLRKADLSNTDLRRATFRGANLSLANLRGANLSDADLRGARLRHASLGGGHLTGANLAGADLTGASLAGAMLAESNLSSAILEKCYLAMANLVGTDFRGARLADADLAWTIWDSETTIWPTTDNMKGAKNISRELERHLGII